MTHKLLDEYRVAQHGTIYPKAFASLSDAKQFLDENSPDVHLVDVLQLGMVYGDTGSNIIYHLRATRQDSQWSEYK